MNIQINRYNIIIYINYVERNTQLQNMNYGLYIDNKITQTNWLFTNFSHISNLFWCCLCIVYNKSLFWISDSNSLYLTLYGNMV